MAAEENAGAEAEATPGQSAEESSSFCIKATGGGARMPEGRRKELASKSLEQGRLPMKTKT